MKESISRVIFFIICIFSAGELFSQLVINEGSNKNYSTIADENGDYEDWIEIHNTGSIAIDLHGYSLTDNNNPKKWVFSHQKLEANQFIIVYCSGKNRFVSKPFSNVLHDTTFQPQIGWNVHQFTTPFYWDGYSNIVLNICTFSDSYTNNSVHLQSTTSFYSSLFSYVDGGVACGFMDGGTSKTRPNIRFNNKNIGGGTLQNTETEYPAPYGNWYWSARHQLLFRASELISSGLTAGFITSISFDVLSTFPTQYRYIDLSLSNTGRDELTNEFIPLEGNFNHTNFKISSEGETIRLFNPAGNLESSLYVNCGPGYDVSSGLLPNASTNVKKFPNPTPGISNNGSLSADSYTSAPVFSKSSGVYTSSQIVNIINTNSPDALIYYTLDGSEPDTTSILWNGNAVYITQTTILRAKAYKTGFIPSTVTSASFLFNINHSTPIISIISDPDNLFGTTGMFDNPSVDMLKAASVDYFDSSNSHQLICSRRVGIIMDGGWGSRGLPQKPFRIKWDDGVLGQGPIMENIIPDRPNRNQYSDFFMRNGSNNYLILPYKDAAQVKMMADGSYNYYAAWRPVSVYINGTYWGLYELREKYNNEMFELSEKASENSIEILSSSAQYGFRLRAVEGNVQHFYDSFNSFSLLNPNDDDFWSKADRYFDLKYYVDYIIAELWMNNADWGANYNNIKIYRSDATGFRWRYCLMDMEYGLLPNPQNLYDCRFDLLGQLLNEWKVVSPNNPHLSIFWKCIQNDFFKNYFINRFADQMNSLYLTSRLLSIEGEMYLRTYSEMANEYRRWGDPNDLIGQMNQFQQNHLLFRNDLLCRPENARNFIQFNFNLPKQVSLNLDVIPRDAGRIKVSTLTPKTYPWQGYYFDGVPIGLEAIAKPGFRFTHWTSNGLIKDTLNRVILDTLSKMNSLITAHFEPAFDLKPLSLLVYPNPAHNQLGIKSYQEIGEAAEVFLLDVLGRKIIVPYTYSDPKESHLNISSLSKGYYFIHFVTKDGKIFRGKFIKY